MAARRSGGFTVLELAIGIVIFTILMASVALTQRATQSLTATTATTGLLQEKAQRGLEAVAFDARWADPLTFLVTAANGSARLDLRVPESIAGGVPVWSSTTTYMVVPSPIDADGDGVLDEGRLVRVRDGATRVLCDFVVPGGFTATTTGTNVRLRLSLAKREGATDALLTADVETSVSLRN